MGDWRERERGREGDYGLLSLVAWLLGRSVFWLVACLLGLFMGFLCGEMGSRIRMRMGWSENRDRLELE